MRDTLCPISSSLNVSSLLLSLRYSALYSILFSRQWASFKMFDLKIKVGLAIMGVQNMFDPYGHNFTLPVVTTFSTIISAVDPVAAISVFEEIHVNRHLYILVFGESLLNDAVTIVLYNTFRPFSVGDSNKMQIVDVLSCVVSFLIVSFGGIAIGFIFGCLTGLVTKFTKKVQIYQPLLCLLIPYLSYCFAECIGVSGILALTVCGLTIKRYMTANLDESTLVSFNYVLKTLSSSAETIIFIMLGVSVSTHKHCFNFPFIAVALASCLIFRFCIVVGMSTILNQFGEPKIRFVDQFVMSYGGIRGAVCYGLVVSWHRDAKSEHEMFISTALIVILMTSIIQGCSIKKIVECLKVQQAEPEKEKSLFEMLVLTAIAKTSPVLSNIAGIEQQTWIERCKGKVQIHLDKWLMIRSASVNSISEKLIKRSQTIMINEAICHIKQYGSYRVLPHTPFEEPTLSTSKSVPNNIAETPSPAKFEQNEPFPFIINNKHIKPAVVENLGHRKESLRAIFQGAVQEHTDQQDPIYTRHNMQNVKHIPTRRFSVGFPEKKEQDNDNTDYSEINSKTVPNNGLVLLETGSAPVMRRRLDTEPSRPTILPQKRIRPKFDVGDINSPNDSNSPLIGHPNPNEQHHVRFERNARVIFRTISEDNEE
ncbi:Sodium/hydrogen exchanger [Aphelenchoides bicaudatus]|nr:Sodium/hydrogen exchanger [Aphelenchoides bicaudatus]